MLILKRVVVCTFFVFLFSVSSFADPVRITSGTVNNSELRITGNGVSYSLEGTNGFGVTPTGNESGLIMYAPGSSPLIVLEIFNRTGTPGNILNMNYLGTAVINGQSYFTQLGADGGFFNSMIFTSQQRITLPSTIPPLPSTGGPATFTVTVPFTMIGTLQGGTCVNSGIPCLNTPSISVYGNGTATYIFGSGGNGLWGLGSYSYEFSASPEPTPEPATLLLFGTGIAGLAAYAAKRKKKKAEPGT